MFQLIVPINWKSRARVLLFPNCTLGNLQNFASRYQCQKFWPIKISRTLKMVLDILLSRFFRFLHSTTMTWNLHTKNVFHSSSKTKKIALYCFKPNACLWNVFCVCVGISNWISVGRSTIKHSTQCVNAQQLQIHIKMHFKQGSTWF